MTRTQQPGGDRPKRTGRLFVDADACPVKDEVIRVGKRHHWPVFLVSNVWLRPKIQTPLVTAIVVDQDDDAADDWIAERCCSGDIVVTQDILLSARTLKAGARVIGNNGKILTDQSIGLRVAMRDLKQQLREMNAIQDHHPPFSRRDRSRFLDGLERLVQQIKRT